MIITDIQKDKKHLVKVSFDNGNSVLLDSEIVSLNCLHQDDDIGEEKLNELVEQSNYSRAKSRALWYLERSPLTEKALFDKLITAGFEERACAKVLARLVELGLVDDLRFAKSFAERCIESNISKRETHFKLITKGVSRELAEQVLSELTVSEEEQIRNLIERKYAKKLTEEKGADKVYAALCRKGFSFSAIKSVMKKYIEELEYYV